jgi:hypothetical protein
VHLPEAVAHLVKTFPARRLGGDANLSIARKLTQDRGQRRTPQAGVACLGERRRKCEEVAQRLRQQGQQLARGAPCRNVRLGPSGAAQAHEHHRNIDTRALARGTRRTVQEASFRAVVAGEPKGHLFSWPHFPSWVKRNCTTVLLLRAGQTNRQLKPTTGKREREAPGRGRELLLTGRAGAR